MKHPYYVEALGKDARQVEALFKQKVSNEINISKMVSHFLTETVKYVFVPLDGDNVLAFRAGSDIAEMVKNSCTELTCTELNLTDANDTEKVVWNPEAFKTKVLVRDSERENWFGAIFSHINKYGKLYPYSIINSNERYKMCIPYEGNEHLLGSDRNPDKEYVIEKKDICISCRDKHSINNLSQVKN